MDAAVSPANSRRSADTCGVNALVWIVWGLRRVRATCPGQQELLSIHQISPGLLSGRQATSSASRSWDWELSVLVTGVMCQTVSGPWRLIPAPRGTPGSHHGRCHPLPLSGAPEGEGSSPWPLGPVLCQAVAVAAQDACSGSALWLGCRALAGLLKLMFGFHTPDLSAKLTSFQSFLFQPA